VICMFMLHTLQLIHCSQKLTSEETFTTGSSSSSSSQSSVKRLSKSSSAVSVCRVCRGKPRKCKCYKYKKVGSRFKCSYSQSVSCNTETTSEPTPSLSLNRTELASMSLADVCGRSTKMRGSATPRSLEGSSGRMGRQGRIINGTQSLFGSWPWQISLRQWNRFQGSYLHKCGATLISGSWAVTAAHCVHEEDYTKILLIMGEHDIYNHRQPGAMEGRKLKKMIVHPRFDKRSFENDLALLELVSPVEYQPHILPACLPTEDVQLEGLLGWVTGWGKMRKGGPLASVLQELEVPILSNRICERMYRKSGHPQYIPHIFICAGYTEGGRDSCGGDSGGPLSVSRGDGRFVVAGVISWGVGCAQINQPGVMTRISEFTPWITDNIV